MARTIQTSRRLTQKRFSPLLQNVGNDLTLNSANTATAAASSQTQSSPSTPLKDIVSVVSTVVPNAPLKKLKNGGVQKRKKFVPRKKTLTQIDQVVAQSAGQQAPGQSRRATATSMKAVGPTPRAVRALKRITPTRVEPTRRLFAPETALLKMAAMAEEKWLNELQLEIERKEALAKRLADITQADRNAMVDAIFSRRELDPFA